MQYWYAVSCSIGTPVAPAIPRTSIGTSKYPHSQGLFDLRQPDIADHATTSMLLPRAIVHATRGPCKHPITPKRALTLLYNWVPLVGPCTEVSIQRQGCTRPIHFSLLITSTVPLWLAPLAIGHATRGPWKLPVASKRALTLLYRWLLLVPSRSEDFIQRQGLKRALHFLLVNPTSVLFELAATVLASATTGPWKFLVASNTAHHSLYKWVPLAAPCIEDYSQQ